ncbi:hypothetical protein Tco_0020925, partial [Tanacetum coccineum]
FLPVDDEGDDEEDPKEDPTDYPADRGDDDDDNDAEEEEHLAPADPAAVAYSADQDLYLAYRVTARMSIRPQAPALFLSEEVAESLLALPTLPPLPLSPYSSPLPQIPSLPLPIPSPPPNNPTYVEGSLGSRAAKIRQRDALPSLIHETSMALENGTNKENHEVNASHHNSSTSRRPYYHHSVTSAQLQDMIDQGVTTVLAARDTTRNDNDSHTSGTGVRRNERAVPECTYQDFMKCQPLFFRGTEGVVDMTQWFERMETVFRISNCIVENQVKFATCTLIRGIVYYIKYY